MAKIIMYRDKFLPIIGGIETHIVSIVQNLPNYEFEILTNAIPHEKTYESFGTNSIIKRFSPIDHTIIPYENSLLSKVSFPYRVVSDVVRLRNIKKYLKNSNFDILHIHSHDICNSLLRIDRRMGKIMFTNLVDFSYVKKPVLFTFHGLYSKLQKNDLIATQYDEKYLNAFDNIVVVDKYIETSLKQLCKVKGLQKNIWFIPNSVDTNTFKYTPYKEHNKLKLGLVGRVEDDISGLKLLTKLVQKKLPWLDISIVGAGTHKAIDHFKADINYKNVKFIPNLAPDKVSDYLSNIDILLNPVLTDAITRVTLESMACGRPAIMIGKEKRGPIINNENGYLIKSNIDELLNLLQELYKDRNSLIEKGKNARTIIENEYSSEVILPKIAKIYEKLIENN